MILRKVEINGHQFYAEGYLHAFLTHDGKAVGLVESQYGNLELYPIACIKFKEPIGQTNRITIRECPELNISFPENS